MRRSRTINCRCRGGSTALAVALFGGVLVLAGVLAPAPALAAPITVIDDGGPDDEPGQKDLNQLTIDADPGTADLLVTWNWDVISVSGANTGDACSLYDTDNDGFANYSLCVIWDNGASYQTTRLYECGDTAADKCTQPRVLLAEDLNGDGDLGDAGEALVGGPYTSTCSLNTVADTFGTRDGAQADTDFDTQAACSIELDDFGGADAFLLNVCSYPSQVPGSDPSDCVVNPNSGFLTIVKVADPDDGTTFTFNLGAGQAANDGSTSFSINGSGSVDLIGFPAGTEYDLTELVPTNWTLDSVECFLSDGTATGTFSGDTISDFEVQVGRETTCTFSNTLDPCLGVDCNDNNSCTLDACVLGECVYTNVLAGTGICTDDNACTSYDGTEGGADACDGAGGCLGTPITCNDDNSCTADSCDPTDGFCDYDPLPAGTGICTDDNACTSYDGTEGGADACDGAGGCLGTPITCNDDNSCTTDACDPADGFCEYTNVPAGEGFCDDGDPCTSYQGVEGGDDACDGEGGCAGDAVSCDDGVACTEDFCDPLTGECDGIPMDSLCDDERVCTLDLCAPDDPDATPSGCAYDRLVDPDGDGIDECFGICRTAGFWGTHSLLIEELQNRGYTDFSVCGQIIDNIDLYHEGSAVEGLCVSPRGDKKIIAARQLISAAYNCVLTVGDPYCADTEIALLWGDLDEACATGDEATISENVDLLDCWNNGGDLSLYGEYGCVLGQCDGIPGAYCGEDGCGPSQECIPFADSCHEQLLENADLGFFFETAGQWVDSTRCREARRTRDDFFRARCPGHPACSLL